jgi:hypothetical protein
VEIASTTLAGQLAASPPTATSGQLPAGTAGLGAPRRGLPFGTKPAQQARPQQQTLAGCGLNGSCNGSCGGGGSCGGVVIGNGGGYSTQVGSGPAAASALSNLYRQVANGDQTPPGWMPDSSCAPCNGNTPAPQPPVQTPPSPLAGVNGVGVGKNPSLWFGGKDD